MLENNTPPAPVGRISLRRRVVEASKWSLGGYGFSLAMRFFSSLLMTRLLAPDMFGIMAIATILIIGLTLFSDLGLKQSIVHSPRGNDPAFLNTAWAIQIVRGVVLWLVALGVVALIVIANYFNIFPKHSVYADPRLPHVIAIVSFTAVIAGFNSTKLFEASRNLALGPVTLIEIFAQIAGFFCMLGWATIDRSIWALVAGSVSSTVVTAILSHLWLTGVPNRWLWNKSAFQEILIFGKWIFFLSILGFVASNGDRLLLGGLVNADTLGAYVIAFMIVNSVELVLSRIIGGVMFPALSEIARERPAYFKAAYYQIHSVVAPFNYFCAGALMMSGQSWIRLLYDSRYVESGWMLEILSASLITIPFQVAFQCYMAIGRPQITLKIAVLRIFALFVGMPIGIHFLGIPGVMFGIVFSQFMCLPLIVMYSTRYGFFDLRKELLFLPIILVGMGAGKVFNAVVYAWTGS